MLDQPETYRLLHSCAAKLSISPDVNDFDRAVFEALYDWYFVPRQDAIKKAAQVLIEESFAHYEQTGELPAWFEQAAAYLLEITTTEADVESLSGYSMLEIPALERWLLEFARSWLQNGKKSTRRSILYDTLPGDEDTTREEQLIKGVQTYAEHFRRDGKLPFYL